MSERIVSADSHVNPPRDLWVRNVPSKFKERAPRVESTPQGDFWIVDSEISGAIGLDSSAGRKPEEFKPHGLTYKDMRPGAYDPKARLEDMDLDELDVSPGAVSKLLEVTRPDWERELGAHELFFESLGGVVPEELLQERDKLAERLRAHS